MPRTDTPKWPRWGCRTGGGGWHSETECQVESSIIVGDQCQGSAIPLRLAGECNCHKWRWSFSLHPSLCRGPLAQSSSTFFRVFSGLETWKRGKQSHSVLLFVRSKSPVLIWGPSDLRLRCPLSASSSLCARLVCGPVTSTFHSHLPEEQCCP